ncbi:MAG: preprotein translocase subunit SecE [Thermoanaerobaculia bacterium]|nr:preprotein translocase subunit SecE [Thermoanaerobaculia bacterium]
MNKLRYFFNEFLPEVKAEWKKVTRPSMREVQTTTLVVVIASFLFALYLWVADQLIIFVYNGMFKVLGL